MCIDFHATILNLDGLDHEKPTFKHLGRRYRRQMFPKVVNGLIA